MRRSVSWWTLAAIRRGDTAYQIQKLTDKLSRQWEKRYSEESAKLAKEFVGKVNRETTLATERNLSSAGFDIKLRDTVETRNIINSLRYTQVDLIKSIPVQELDKVAGIVQRSVQNGRDIYYVQSELEKRFDMTEERARLIAIDQNNKATQAIRQARDLEAGITEGIWDHVPGRKTSRPTHVKMNGKRFQLYGIDKGLYDSAVGRKVMPGELVACACGYHAIIPD
ncbi:MAG: phage minor head protein [Oxalobacter formigenes]|nr:phage minor head protein [Oxalobacter formigenes]